MTKIAFSGRTAVENCCKTSYVYRKKKIVTQMKRKLWKNNNNSNSNVSNSTAVRLIGNELSEVRTGRLVRLRHCQINSVTTWRDRAWRKQRKKSGRALIIAGASRARDNRIVKNRKQTLSWNFSNFNIFLIIYLLIIFLKNLLRSIFFQQTPHSLISRVGQ